MTPAEHAARIRGTLNYLCLWGTTNHDAVPRRDDALVSLAALEAQAVGEVNEPSEVPAETPTSATPVGLEPGGSGGSLTSPGATAEPDDLHRVAEASKGYGGQTAGILANGYLAVEAERDAALVNNAMLTKAWYAARKERDAALAQVAELSAAVESLEAETAMLTQERDSARRASDGWQGDATRYHAQLEAARQALPVGAIHAAIGALDATSNSDLARELEAWAAAALAAVAPAQEGDT